MLHIVSHVFATQIRRVEMRSQGLVRETYPKMTTRSSAMAASNEKRRGEFFQTEQKLRELSLLSI